MTARPGRDIPDLRLVAPAIAAWLVAWQVRRLPVEVVVVGAALLVLAAGVVLLRSRGSAVALVMTATLVCAAAAGLSMAARSQVRTTGPLPLLAARAAAVAVTGVVLDDPRRAAVQRGRDPLVVVRIRVEVLEAGGRTTTLRAPLLVLSTDDTWLSLLPSQHVRAEGRLQAAEPGDDVAAVLSGRGPPQVRSPPDLVQRVAGHLRAGLRDAVAPLPDDERGLLPGLVVGDTSRLPADLRDDFRTVGLTHLVAVSGDTAGHTGLSGDRSLF